MTPIAKLFITVCYYRHTCLPIKRSNVYSKKNQLLSTIRKKDIIKPVRKKPYRLHSTKLTRLRVIYLSTACSTILTIIPTYKQLSDKKPNKPKMNYLFVFGVIIRLRSGIIRHSKKDYRPHVSPTKRWF